MKALGDWIPLSPGLMLFHSPPESPMKGAHTLSEVPKYDRVPEVNQKGPGFAYSLGRLFRSH